MKRKANQRVITFIMVIVLLSISNITYSQYYTKRYLTRGADTAEFYLSCYWYQSQMIQWSALYHSNDNGKTISIQRKSNMADLGGQIYGDAAPGAIFQIPYSSVDSIGISFDSGKTFQGKYSSLVGCGTAGCQVGEVYVAWNGLYRSNNYGMTFTFQSNMDSIFPHDVGVLPGELFGLKFPYYNGPLGLAYSSDFGHNFRVSLITFPNASLFQYCQVHRGTQPGELFFLVLKTFDTIYLYHSLDYGHSLSLKNVIPYFIDGSDETYFTPGRAPGTVYLVRRGVCGPLYYPHTCLWIDFSRDYGITFTRYFHEIDSLYTDIPLKPETVGLKIFPNPAQDVVTIDLVQSPLYFAKARTSSLSPGSRKNDMTLELYSILGEKIFQKKISLSLHQISLDVSMLTRGVCFLRLTSNGQQITTAKLILN